MLRVAGMNGGTPLYPNLRTPDNSIPRGSTRVRVGGAILCGRCHRSPVVDSICLEKNQQYIYSKTNACTTTRCRCGRLTCVDCAAFVHSFLVCGLLVLLCRSFVFVCRSFVRSFGRRSSLVCAPVRPWSAVGLSSGVGNRIRAKKKSQKIDMRSSNMK